MAQVGLFRRHPKPEPPLSICVQFEPDGKVYTYSRTLAQFADLMRGRYQMRGEVPHRAWFVDEQGEETVIRFE